MADNPAIDGFFYPANLALTRTQGDNLNAPASYSFITKTGVVPNGPQIRYLSAPAAAQTHPTVNSWLYYFSGMVTSTCFNTINSSDCLPAGDYTAAVDYTVDSSAGTTTYTLPVTLHIVPAP